VVRLQTQQVGMRSTPSPPLPPSLPPYLQIEPKGAGHALEDAEELREGGREGGREG